MGNHRDVMSKTGTLNRCFIGSSSRLQLASGVEIPHQIFMMNWFHRVVWQWPLCTCHSVSGAVVQAHHLEPFVQVSWLKHWDWKSKLEEQMRIEYIRLPDGPNQRSSYPPMDNGDSEILKSSAIARD